MASIGEICNRNVVVGTRDMTVSHAAKLMRRQHVGSIVVVEKISADSGFPIGIVTDRDVVVEVTAMDLDPATLTLGDVMSHDLVTARDTEGPLETMEIMRYKGVRRLPIVNADGRLIGIVSIDDLIGVLSEQLGELAKIIAREQARESSARR